MRCHDDKTPIDIIETPKHVRQQTLYCARCGKPLFIEETKQILLRQWIKDDHYKICSSNHTSKTNKFADLCINCSNIIEQTLLNMLPYKNTKQ